MKAGCYGGCEDVDEDSDGRPRPYGGSRFYYQQRGVRNAARREKRRSSHEAPPVPDYFCLAFREYVFKTNAFVMYK